MRIIRNSSEVLNPPGSGVAVHAEAEGDIDRDQGAVLDLGEQADSGEKQADRDQGAKASRGSVSFSVAGNSGWQEAFCSERICRTMDRVWIGLRFCCVRKPLK
jgi:hypothetical protein